MPNEARPDVPTGQGAGRRTKINAIVPYAVAGQASTTISVLWNKAVITAAGVPVAAAAPAIFTLNYSGLGAAAVLNSDNSVNGPASPAARGSLVQIFATGEGVTSPAGITGEVTTTDTKQPVLPVSATIGGMAASIVYAGSAPDEVAGLFQVNAMVPAGVTPGPAVPIALTVGTLSSPAGVTIAVK